MTGRSSAPGTRQRRVVTVAAVAVLAVAADQITKSLAVADLATHDVHVIGPFSLRLTYNTGIAFSLGSGLTGPIIVAAVALVLAIAWMARGVPSTAAAVASGLVLGGAVGNLADRLFRGHHGGVVDFIYTRFWPTFNVADACIVTGCLLLAVSFARGGRSAQSTLGAPTETSSTKSASGPGSVAARAPMRGVLT